MKPVKTFHLLCEERFSFGRITAMVGAAFILFLFFAVTYPAILSGKIYRYDLQTAFLGFFAYGLFTFFIIAGLLGHKMQKWYEYKIELYLDNWVKTILIHPDGYEEEAYISPELICRVPKYKKRYSKRKKNWYIRLYFDFCHDKELYEVTFYGWIIEPKDVKEFDKFAEMLKKLAEENRKKSKWKIPPPIAAYGVRTWLNSEYGSKLFEEREKMMEGDKNDWSN